MGFVKIKEGLEVFHKNGFFATIGNHQYKLRADEDFFRILPLLEMNPKETKDIIDRIEFESGGVKFPISSVINSAILGLSDYWVERAINCISKLELKIDQSTINLLIESNELKPKWLSQKNRHAINDLINKNNYTKQ